MQLRWLSGVELLSPGRPATGRELFQGRVVAQRCWPDTAIAGTCKGRRRLGGEGPCGPGGAHRGHDVLCTVEEERVADAVNGQGHGLGTVVHCLPGAGR